MQNCVSQDIPTTMVAIMCISRNTSDLEKIIEECADLAQKKTGKISQVANFNSPIQVRP